MPLQVETKRFLILFSFFQVNLSMVFANNYYVSSSGNDRNSGRSIKDAWKGLEKVSQQKFEPGDTVFFRCDDVFMGTLELNSSGTVNNPIVYTSFGKGKKPKLKGTFTITEFANTGENRHQSKAEQDILFLYHSSTIFKHEEVFNIYVRKTPGRKLVSISSKAFG